MSIPDPEPRGPSPLEGVAQTVADWKDVEAAQVRQYREGGHVFTLHVDTRRLKASFRTVGRQLKRTQLRIRRILRLQEGNPVLNWAEPGPLAHLVRR